MPILYTPRRAEVPIVRVAEFRGDGLIINGRVVDSEMRLMNRNLAQLNTANGNTIIGRNYLYLPYRLTQYGSLSDREHQWSCMINRIDADVSSGTANSEWMRDVWFDPANEDRNYMIAGVTYNYYDSSEDKRPHIMKLDRNGNILVKASIKLNYPKILHISDKYVAIIGICLGMDGYVPLTGWVCYILILDANTLEFIKYIDLYNVPNGIGRVSDRTYVPNVLYRDDDVIAMVGKMGEVFYVDINDQYKFNAVPIRDGKIISMHKGVQYTYSTYTFAAPFRAYTAPMKNGYHYAFDAWPLTDGSPIKWCAVKFNSDTRTYDSYNGNDNTVIWNSSIPQDLRNIKKFKMPDSTTDGRTDAWLSNGFLCYKISDTKFFQYQTIMSGLRNEDGVKDYVTTWWIVEIDTNDPKILHVRAAGRMDHPYREEVMIHSGNKFIFCLEGQAFHEYIVKPETNTVELTRNIRTPNACSAGLFNGVFWWVNKNTNELNYEIEKYYDLNANVYNVDDGFIKPEVMLQDADTPGTNTYRISVYDKFHNRVAVKLRLTAVGAITFDDNMKTRIVDTLTTDDLQIPLIVTGSAENYIQVEVVG